MPVFPADATDLTRLLVVGNLRRSVDWYRDVLGAEIVGEYGGTSAVIRFVGSWLLLVTGGGPTADKPTVTMAAPDDPDRASAELIIAVPDCQAAHAELAARGAAFLADPVESAWEIRAFFRDPDGHLFEISQRKPAADRPARSKASGARAPRPRGPAARHAIAVGARPRGRPGALRGHPHVHGVEITGLDGQPASRHSGYCRASLDDEHRSPRPRSTAGH